MRKILIGCAVVALFLALFILVPKSNVAYSNGSSISGNKNVCTTFDNMGPYSGRISDGNGKMIIPSDTAPSGGIEYFHGATVEVSCDDVTRVQGPATIRSLDEYRFQQVRDVSSSDCSVKFFGFAAAVGGVGVVKVLENDHASVRLVGYQPPKSHSAGDGFDFKYEIEAVNADGTIAFYIDGSGDFDPEIKCP